MNIQAVVIASMLAVVPVLAQASDPGQDARNSHAACRSAFSSSSAASSCILRSGEFTAVPPVGSCRIKADCRGAGGATYVGNDVVARFDQTSTYNNCNGRLKLTRC